MREREHMFDFCQPYSGVGHTLVQHVIFGYTYTCLGVFVNNGKRTHHTCLKCPNIQVHSTSFLSDHLSDLFKRSRSMDVEIWLLHAAKVRPQIHA